MPVACGEGAASIDDAVIDDAVTLPPALLAALEPASAPGPSAALRAVFVRSSHISVLDLRGDPEERAGSCAPGGAPGGVELPSLFALGVVTGPPTLGVVADPCPASSPAACASRSPAAAAISRRCPRCRLRSTASACSSAKIRAWKSATSAELAIASGLALARSPA